jgi:putative peptidoglycan lipid II flippase
MEILTRAFYAQHDTKTPVIIGTIAMGLNVVFSIGFSRLFEQVGWMPHGGLALANSLATALEASALFAVMRKRLSGIGGKFLLQGFAVSTIAVITMGLALFGWLQFTSGWRIWLSALGGVAAGSLVYALVMWALRVPELSFVVSRIKRRLIRNPQREP